MAEPADGIGVRLISREEFEKGDAPPATSGGAFDDIPYDKNAAPVTQAASAGAFADLPQSSEPPKPAPASWSAGIASMLQGMSDTEEAARQRANPTVRKGGTMASDLGLTKPPKDADEFWRKPLGELEQHDFGSAYTDPATGELRLINPKTDVILRDPATGKHMVFERSAKLDDTKDSTMASIARLVMPGMATGPVTGVVARAGEVTGDILRAQRAAKAAADLDAFDAHNVRPYGPAFSGPMAGSTAKQVGEFAYIGDPVRNALTESTVGAKRAVEGVADLYGSAQKPEDAGRVIQGAMRDELQDVQGRLGAATDAMTDGRAANPADLSTSLQQGLERYQGAGFTKLEPRTVEGLGIDPMAPVQQSPNRGVNQAARVEQAEDIRRDLGGGMATTTRGIPVPMRRTNVETYATRRTVGDLSDAELQSVIRAPSVQTSFMTRVEALYERAWRLLPNQFRVDGSRNPQMIPAANLRTELGQIDQGILSQLSGQRVLGGDLARRLLNVHAGNISISELRAIRTEIGRALGDTSILDKASLSRSQLKQLYGAASRDMENGIIDLANRAYLHTRDGNNTSHITADMARRADGALRALKLADRYMRAGMERMERFQKVLRADTTEAAANAIISSAQGRGRGNMNMLRTALAVLRPDERNDIAALVLDRMGMPRATARGITADAGFDPSEFVKNLNALDPTARELLFRGQHMSEISAVIEQAHRWDRVRGLLNIQSPEDIYKAVLAAATNKGPAATQRIREVSAVLTAEEKGQVASVMIREMGEPVGSARGMVQDVGFSASSMTTNWAKMSDEAKRAFFDGPHRKALDDAVRIADRLSNDAALANTSRTLTNAQGIGTLSAGAAMLASGGAGWELALGTLATMGAASILFSRASYARWTVQYAQLRAAALRAPPGKAMPAIAAHIERLAIMAKQDPKLMQFVERAAAENGVLEGGEDQKPKNDQLRH